MRGLGCIVRADLGGLASLTYEVFRHLRPERVLLVDLGLAARGGRTHPERYDVPGTEVTVTQWQRPGFEIDRFLDGLDVCYTAETPYFDRVYPLARQYRVAVVLHAMPELASAVDRQATAIWAPTDWEFGRMPSRAEVLPMPVALDQFNYRRRTRCDTLYFTRGEAMCDRPGWDIVQAALPLISHPCRLLWRGPLEPDPAPVQVGKVTLECLPPVDHYEDATPDDADLLLLPRRYGGLSLPTQEAAACGIPSIMTALSPQTGWIEPDLLIPAVPTGDVSMKGGRFTVFDADPRDLAATIDRLIEDPGRMIRASLDARKWAESLGWDVRLADWEARLERLATRR